MPEDHQAAKSGSEQENWSPTSSTTSTSVSCIKSDNLPCTGDGKGAARGEGGLRSNLNYNCKTLSTFDTFSSDTCKFAGDLSYGGERKDDQLPGVVHGQANQDYRLRLGSETPTYQDNRNPLGHTITSKGPRELSTGTVTEEDAK